MKLFQEELIKNFPDYYNKEPTSNNYKLMELIKYGNGKYQTLLEELEKTLDLETASGYTLNLYGDMVGQKRGHATDEQYRVMIKTKMAQNRCTGSYPSIVDCLCRVLNCDSSKILIEEREEPCTVALSKIPLEVILNAAFTPQQFVQLVAMLLPAGVKLDSSSFEGTFEFATYADEYDENKGFGNIEQTIGGYIGMLASTGEESPILPL